MLKMSPRKQPMQGKRVLLLLTEAGGDGTGKAGQQDA